MLCDLPVALSFADTFKIPFESMSNVTSICGTPRGAGGMLSKWNLPIVLFWFAIGRSPCNTWISTPGWLSTAVENVSDLRVGIVVLASMSFVITPPSVSIPNDNGVTSSKRTSLTSPVKTPPWIDAPIATTSSGLTPFEGSFLKKSLTMFWIAGIRVEPPTKITSSMSFTVMLASAKALRHGSIVARIKSSHNCSNLARVSLRTKCLGPVAVAVIYGKLISVSVDDDNSILAFSAASLRRCNDIGSFLRSMFSSRMNSSASQLMILPSKSSPPR